ncbi:PLP-dependent aminotransferase family protein [uncultured Phycicoccus sp.]|uniref:MocR-like transcription factor YczR n=1 Tax=uncultured Phycicoccus sp. TaxID=661422 RepID=UPI00261319F2|nr:PLP-dependent aminotransferase family protein [uncultured Phycicoccus sp.]
MSPATPTVSAARTARLVGDVARARPAYRALADALRLAVADGRIAVGTRLPSERDLTHHLGLSRTTVTRAYDVLREAGYLASRQGSGSVATLPSGTHPRGTGGLFPADVAANVVDLTCAATRAPSGIVEAYERAVEQLPAYLTGAGYLTFGVPELREAIAQRYRDRGLPTSADDVLVTSGAVAGLGVVARALLRPGDRVVVEDPTYPNTLDGLRALGARLRAIPVDPDGWDVEESARTIGSASARAAVLIPDFHNPTGALMADEQRAALAHRLRAAGTTPVIDETVAEIDLEGGRSPLPFAAHSVDAISVGSSSKSHWGGLRTGWIRAPRGALRALVESRVTSDLGAPVLEQLVLVELLRQAPALTAERRSDLVAARNALTAALREDLPELRFRVPRGGLSLWCELPDGVGSTALTAAAEAEGLLVASGPRFAVDGGLDRWIRIPHVLPPETMTEAVARLARAAHRVRSGRASTGERGRRHTAGARRPLVA